MATDTAAPSPAPPGPRHLWQLPTFFLGVSAFLAVWQGWLPLGARDPAADHLRDIETLKAVADRATPDAAELHGLIERISRSTENFPEHGPAAHYALGSGYVRLAEVAADPGEAGKFWKLARQHFESVKPNQLRDPTDAPRLAFRAAKARAATLPADAPLSEIQLVRNLLLTPPAEEKLGSANLFAADLALRLSPPDWKSARECLASFVADGSASAPGAIDRAKLRLADLSRQLNEPEQARKWLLAIGPDAPADIQAIRSAAVARMLMTEENWSGAAREWESLRAASGAPLNQRLSAAYYLGVCRLSGRTPDVPAAIQLFTEASKSEGPEGPAAQIRLARAMLTTPGDAPASREAAALLADATRKAVGPNGYANPLIPVNEVQAGFELAIQKLTAAGDFDAAVAATEAYKGVARANKARIARATTLAAWGTTLQQKADPEAKAKLTAAAEEYLAMVGSEPRPEGKAEMLQRAAAVYKQAGDRVAALSVLEQLVRLPGLPEPNAGPAWLEYAEGLVAANRPEEAFKAFREVLATAGPTRVEATARLARGLIETRDPRLVGFGQELYKQLVDKESVDPAEAAVHERALVELAHEYIRNGGFRDAEAVLRKQLHTYPTGPEAGLAQLLRGVCLIQMASAKPEPSDAPRWRSEALKLFEQVADDADRRIVAGMARERDEWLRLHGSLRVLQAYLQMGQPGMVLSRAAVLLQRHLGTVEELIILSLIYHAQKQSNRPELALHTRDRMREVFEQLRAKPGAFPASSGEYSRDYWEKIWFAEGAKSP